MRFMLQQAVEHGAGRSAAIRASRDALARLLQPVLVCLGRSVLLLEDALVLWRSERHMGSRSHSEYVLVLHLQATILELQTAAPMRVVMTARGTHSMLDLHAIRPMRGPLERTDPASAAHETLHVHPLHTLSASYAVVTHVRRSSQSTAEASRPRRPRAPSRTLPERPTESQCAHRLDALKR